VLASVVGRDLLVPYAEREEFIRLSINARLQESSKQIAAMRKGLDAVVPTHMLSLFTWRDLELQVCGDPAIDIAVLKRHTVYNKLSATDDVVVWLFKALHSFTAEERQLFLRFVWGRNRLPATESDWGSSFTINALSSNVSDESLPISHTCFFSIGTNNTTQRRQRSNDSHHTHASFAWLCMRADVLPVRSIVSCVCLLQICLRIRVMTRCAKSCSTPFSTARPSMVRHTLGHACTPSAKRTAGVAHWNVGGLFVFHAVLMVLSFFSVPCVCDVLFSLAVSRFQPSECGCNDAQCMGGLNDGRPSFAALVLARLCAALGLVARLCRFLPPLPLLLLFLLLFCCVRLHLASCHFFAFNHDRINCSGPWESPLRGMWWKKKTSLRATWLLVVLRCALSPVGGPFRESFTNLSADLMSANTNLFLLSPNGASSVGLNRSSYVPSPSASSTQQLAQLEWLGALFGVALRTKPPLALDLPSADWKSPLGT
jgi:hypothetical protein